MTPVLLLFTQNLRISNNEALQKAQSLGPIVPLFIYDETHTSRPLGRMSKLWLYHSLTDLKKKCPELAFFYGNPLTIIPKLQHLHHAKHCVIAHNK